VGAKTRQDLTTTLVGIPDKTWKMTVRRAKAFARLAEAKSSSVNLPAGDSVLAYRDRAIVKLYLYSGIRLAAGCYLLVEDFRQDGEEATPRLREKGDKRRTIGLHYAAAQAIQEYIHRIGSTSGPLFRPRRHSHTEELGTTSMDPRTMWVILKRYLGDVPNALRERELPSGEKTIECV
jgi:site-specific recombinase XerD